MSGVGEGRKNCLDEEKWRPVSMGWVGWAVNITEDLDHCTGLWVDTVRLVWNISMKDNVPFRFEKWIEIPPARTPVFGSILSSFPFGRGWRSIGFVHVMYSLAWTKFTMNELPRRFPTAFKLPLGYGDHYTPADFQDAGWNRDSSFYAILCGPDPCVSDTDRQSWKFGAALSFRNDIFEPLTWYGL